MNLPSSFAVVYHNRKDLTNRAILLNKRPSFASLWQRAGADEDVYYIFGNRVMRLYKIKIDETFDLQQLIPEEVLTLFSAKMTSIRNEKL